MIVLNINRHLKILLKYLFLLKDFYFKGTITEIHGSFTSEVEKGLIDRT